MTMSTFHPGERAVQARVGVATRMAEVGPLVIRGHMPDQHRDFFVQLPFVLAGTLDAAGQPWASVLAAAPGFMHSPDPTHLSVRAVPLPGDPLADNLHEGASISLLGLEPHTRRRNRMNGVVREVDGSGFAVQVDQSFGNCPKYIQARAPEFVPGWRGASPAMHEGARLDDDARQLIARADTFFIATAYAAHTAPGDADPSHGVDVSHRGGKPGFVRVDEDGTLTVPDFVGNFFFNTLGNIAAYPRAGLLFMDYGSGDVLYLAVRAEIVWEGADLEAFSGAQRLLRFEVLSMRRVEAVLPLRWGPAALSPVLAATGAWN
ncbi:MAG: pyridoxamine 5-phosphate oxidase-related, FMN-binding protein [Polaromonas sp.]|nr:pyridoxamine 5-phosphate oxidase-related, FMN-binding protein [Polaromonas sp.]